MGPQLTIYDHAVIVFYFLFMAMMGWVFKRFIKNTSDYFRAGGEMLWWIVGAGAFMVSFSAVTFTGMAGKAYVDGPVVLVIFVGNAIGFLGNLLFFAPAFRQMRCVTAIQGVRNRFGSVSEQFFTWLQIPIGIMYAGIWLNGLAVFVSAAFGINEELTILITGAVVVFMAMAGGSWSVTASDFVQMLLLMPITVVAAVLALNHVGGVGAFVERAPSKFWHWGESANSWLILLWVLAMLLQKFVSTNNMLDASRYLSVKDSRNARYAAALGMVLFIVGPVIWFIPPMVASVTHADIHATFPNLKNPQEASYFAIALATMPAGMIGLLLSGIFAATMSSMDSGLNRNAGFFIKNFYQLYIKPRAGERELMVASVITTFVLGVFIIGAAVMFNRWEGLTIFRLMVNFGAWVALPYSIPLVLGLLVKRAPSWAGWSTILVGFGASLFTNFSLDAAWFARTFGWTLSPREASDWAQLAGIFVNLLVGCGWFFFTCRFARYRPAEEVQRVESFFRLLRTPVDFAREEGRGSDNVQGRLMGKLCLIYGGFVTLLMLIPNSPGGRMAFAFCGLTMFAVGALLYRSGMRAQRRAAAQVLPGGSHQPAGDALAHGQPRRPGLEVVAAGEKEALR